MVVLEAEEDQELYSLNFRAVRHPVGSLQRTEALVEEVALAVASSVASPAFLGEFDHVRDDRP